MSPSLFFAVIIHLPRTMKWLIALRIKSSRVIQLLVLPIMPRVNLTNIRLHSIELLRPFEKLAYPSDCFVPEAELNIENLNGS